MNRRDFLDPRRLAGTAGQVLGALEDLRTLGDREAVDEATLLRFARRAMATTFEVLLPFGTPRATAAAEAALDEIDRLEDQLSVFREESEVSRLNRLAVSEPVAVQENLFNLLLRAAQISNDTEGAFDITAGALTKAWGFFRRAGRVPPVEERNQVVSRVGIKHVVLDPENRSVRYLRPGLEINLGSIGKGYALDRAADILRHDWNCSSALLHGGRSSVYAIGTQGNRGWAVGIRHPWDPERRLAVVWLRDRALATSAATFQHLEYAGRKLGHILDPRTGWPAEGMASASVLARTAAEADALATAFFILGVDKARRYCEDRQDIGAVLVPDGESRSPIIIGLSDEEVGLAS